MRLHSVSLYDEQANCLWLSEGALGPDEHNLVLDALEVLSNDKSLPCYENGVEDGRVAIFLPIRAPTGGLVGVALILADLKSVGDGVLEKVVSPQVRPIMQKIAVLMRASAPKGAEPPAPIAVQVAPVVELAPERAPPARPAAPQAAAPAPAKAPPPPVAKPATNGKVNGAHPPKVPSVAGAQPPGLRPPTAAAAPEQSLSPQAIDDILEFELFPDVGTPPTFSSEDEVPMSPASRFQQPDSLAWDVTGSSLQLIDDIPAALPPVVEPPKPAASSARRPVPSLEPQPGPPFMAGAQPDGLRPVAKPVAPTLAAASIPVASIPVAAPANLAPPIVPVLQSAAAQAPVLQAPVLQTPVLQAPTAAAVPSTAANLTPIAAGFDLTPPAALMNGAAANPTPAPAAPVASVTPAASAANAAAAATKSTGATTTSKALSTGNVQALSATQTSRTIALDPANLILDIQPFSKLRAGGRMRRYEVLPRIPHRDANRAPAVTDGLALQRLLTWLGSNRSAWNLEPTSFSLNLSISSIEDERFLQQVASSLKTNGIAPDNLGFEIAEPLCTQRRAQVERFITLCDKLGCFVVIDDFSFDSSVLPLLRSKALRLVKIDPKLTSVALKDKLSQAMVVAIVQAVKVLGIHCAAKRVESQASLQWLTAIGCDLAQGPALSQVLPIESLNMPQAPAAADTGKVTG